MEPVAIVLQININNIKWINKKHSVNNNMIDYNSATVVNKDKTSYMILQ